MLFRSALTLVLTLTLTACSRAPTAGGAQPIGQLANGTVIDGIQVGTPIDCAAPADCSDVLSFAQTAAIKTRGLDPSAIADTSVYTPYVPDNMVSTGGGFVVVYDLIDGSKMAIRAHCGVGPCQVVPLQPLVDTPPVPSDYSNPEGGSPDPDDQAGPSGIAEPHVA
jgi:hypothetical protein